MADDFMERMGRLAKAIVARADSCRNEEQTKQSLIQPVIHVLGYDIFNPEEVIMEYACDAPVLKTRSGKPESVDYAIRIAGTLAILVEAKDTGENLDRHGGQLARYFMATKCRHAVLTNGLEWRFFSDLDRDNVMDEDPYRIVDMRNLSEDDIAFFSGFCKDRFSEDGLRSEAEKAMYASKINDYIKTNIIGSMSDEIVRVILGHIYEGIKSAAVVARFRPMISEEFDKCVAEKYAIRSSLVRKSEEHGGNPVGIGVPNDAPEEETATEGVSPVSVDAAPSFPIEVFFAAGDGSFDAKALYLGGNRITILAGSRVAREEKAYIARNAHDLRQQFVDGDGVVTRDVTMDSASTAGAFVNGGVCDAGRYWKVADGRTITSFLGAKTWGEASRIAPSQVHAKADVADDTDDAVEGDSDVADASLGQEFPIFMRTRRMGTVSSYDVTATYLGSKQCRLHVGGQCSLRCDNYVSQTARRLRDAYLDENGVVIKELEGSLSMVGSVVRGSTCDGTRNWRLRDGRRIREVLIGQGDEEPPRPIESSDSEPVTWPVRVSYASTERAVSQFSATALVYEDGTTVVEAGSVIGSVTTPSLGKYARAIREAELAKIVPDEEGRYVLQEGHEVRFNSASTAGAFVSGTSVNGNLAWRDEHGRRLGDLK